MNMWLHKTVLQKLADNGGNIPKELLDWRTLSFQELRRFLYWVGCSLSCRPISVGRANWTLLIRMFTLSQCTWFFVNYLTLELSASIRKYRYLYDPNKSITMLTQPFEKLSRGQWDADFILQIGIEKLAKDIWNLFWLLAHLFGLNARWESFLFIGIAIARTARNCSHQKPNYMQCESKILRFIYVRIYA
jgi:hypothetical protein